MKKFILISFLLIMFANISFAEVMQKENDGFFYWNGDLNYLIIESGSHFLDAVDLRSTNILHDDKNGFEFSIRCITINANKNQIERETTINFFEHYQSGKIYRNYNEWKSFDAIAEINKRKKFNKMKLTALKMQ